MKAEDNGTQRSFETGATRDTAEGKLDFEGFLSPPVLRQYAKYMNMNRLQSDGTLRGSDNWQSGIPTDVYLKSGWRHFFEWWAEHRAGNQCDVENMIASMCGLMFNVMGYMHEILKDVEEVDFDGDEPTEEIEARKEKIAAALERIQKERNTKIEKEWFESIRPQQCFTCLHITTPTEFPPCNTCTSYSQWEPQE